MRGAAALAALIFAACQDLGPPRREHETPRAAGTPAHLDTPPDLDALLAGPAVVRCARATLALSAALRDELAIDGEVTPLGGRGAHGRGAIRLRLRGLQVDCTELELFVLDPGAGRFLLAAQGEVSLERADTTLQARSLLIDEGGLQLAGAPRLDIDWPLSAPPPESPSSR